MPAQVTYWTGVWQPGAEALSNEVHAVRAALSPGAPVVSFSMGQRSRIAWRDRAICLSGDRWLLLKATAALVEPLGRLTHAWGSLGEWHFVRGLGRRPLILTVAYGGQAHSANHYRKVRMFVVEGPDLFDALRRTGIAEERIRLVHPGVDLREFCHAPVSGHRFRLLFASSPAHTAEFAARGIPLLVETARACPDVDVVLLWRPLGDQDKARRTLAALSPPPNLLLEVRGTRSMPEVYRSAHAVACVYADGFGKTTPNSVVEGLACGRPVIVGRSCGIADLIRQARAGQVIGATLDETVAAVRDIQRDWTGWSARARLLAEQHFGLDRFIEAYAQVYADAL